MRSKGWEMVRVVYPPGQKASERGQLDGQDGCSRE